MEKPFARYKARLKIGDNKGFAASTKEPNKVWRICKMHSHPQTSILTEAHVITECESDTTLRTLTIIPNSLNDLLSKYQISTEIACISSICENPFVN